MMVIAKKALPRRTLLRGMGVSLGLPLLDAMVPSMTVAPAAAKPVRRLGFVYIPMGANIAKWKPSTIGKLTELSKIVTQATDLLSRREIGAHR